MIYLDTSALLKLFILEEESEELQNAIMAQDHPLPIWEIQEAELINALRLKAFWKEITAVQAEQQIKLFHLRKNRGMYFFPVIDRQELMDTFVQLSAKTPQLGCRTMDIFHVACAKVIGATKFISYDARQMKLAKYAGLKI